MSLSWKPIAAVLALPALCLPVGAQETVKIGVIQPLTGSVAYNGQAFVAGAKLAVERRNAAGGVGGRKIELVIEDGQCRPANSVNAAEKLIQRDKVVAVAGAFCSSATAAVMPVAEKYKVPLLTGVSSKADLTDKGMQYFFRSAETDRLMSKTFSKILADKLQLKSVAYIGVNDDWGRGGVEDFSKDMERARREDRHEGVLRPWRHRLLHPADQAAGGQARWRVRGRRDPGRLDPGQAVQGVRHSTPRSSGSAPGPRPTSSA